MNRLPASAAIECIHNLPAGIEQPLGREDELAELDSALERPGTLASLTGLAGAGKSLLAMWWSYRFAVDVDTNEPRDGRFVWVLDASRDGKTMATMLRARRSLEESDLPTLRRSRRSLVKACKTLPCAQRQRGPWRTSFSSSCSRTADDRSCSSLTTCPRTAGGTG